MPAAAHGEVRRVARTPAGIRLRTCMRTGHRAIPAGMPMARCRPLHNHWRQRRHDAATTRWMITTRHGFVALLCLLPVMPALARYHEGVGNTPEAACWTYNFEANRHAREKHSCYTACRPGMPSTRSEQYRFGSNVPNDADDCDKPKYDIRTPLSDAEFVARNPPPAGVANPVTPASTGAAAAEP